MLDNFDVAVLSKVNELAGRYGIKPYEFVATGGSVPVDDGGDHYRLRFEALPPDSKAFDTLLHNLGLNPEAAELVGTTEEIFKALESAIAKSPRPRNR